MTPTTKAGRALASDYPGDLDMEEEIAVIEREAAQQERKRICKWLVDMQIHHPDSWVVAKLAEPIK